MQFHVPDEHLAEMRAQAQCMRAGFAILNDREPGDYPMLFAKSSTQTVRQISAGCEIRLQTAPIGKYLLYALRIFDDADPYALWSIVEGDDEIRALRKILVEQERFGLYLFNERALNVAFAVSKCVPKTDLMSVSRALRIKKFAAPNSSQTYHRQADEVLEQIQVHKWSPKNRVVDAQVVPSEWDVESSFRLVGRKQDDTLFLSSLSEHKGTHFEQLIEIISTDEDAHAVYRSPKRKSDNEELCDVLVVGKAWAVVIQAKAWDIDSGEVIADRERLRRRAIRNVRKGLKQTKGAIRRIRLRESILDSEGTPVDLSEVKILHGLVIASELSLLDRATEFGGECLHEIYVNDDVQLQIIDSIELQRLMTARFLFESKGVNWFPAALEFRWRGACNATTPYVYLTDKIEV